MTDTAQAKIDRLNRSIARGGESITIERLATNNTTGASVVEMSVATPAWIRSSEPQDLTAAGVKDIKIIISPTSIMAATIGSPPTAFGLPLKDDRILLQGFSANIEDLMPIYYQGTLVRVNIVARG